jgi:hypothetical protein
MEAMAREGRRRAWLLGALMTLALVSVGCSSTLNSRYYLMAHDPVTEVTNYFRISVHGSAHFSKAKYSVGFYDRSTVEQLFGEAALQREYLASALEAADLGTDKGLKELAEALKESREAREAVLEARLVTIAGTVGELAEQMTARLAERFGSESWLEPALERARAQRALAIELVRAKKLNEAQQALTIAQAALEGVHVALDGKVLVRFFDGAGNEVPVFNKTMVIFVATDVSRFAEALRQIASTEAAQQDLLRIVLGKKIQEAELEEKRSERSKTALAGLERRLGDIVKDQALPTGRNDGAGKPLEGAALQKKQKEDLARLNQILIQLATAVGGTGAELRSAAEIRGFVAGQGGGQ